MAVSNGSNQIAQSLGWDLALLESVARKHQIELCSGIGRSNNLNQCQGSAGGTDHRSPHTAKYPDGLNWNPRTREVSRHGLVTALPSVQADFFSVLYHNYRFAPERFVLAGELIAVSAHAQLSSVARELRPKLETMCVLIDGNKGNGGGYRLRIEA